MKVTFNPIFLFEIINHDLMVNRIHCLRKEVIPVPIEIRIVVEDIMIVPRAGNRPMDHPQPITVYQKYMQEFMGNYIDSLFSI
jgi:hypothetical protein